MHEDEASDRERESDWHGDGAYFEEVPEAHFKLFFAQGEQPQDGGQRAGDG